METPEKKIARNDRLIANALQRINDGGCAHGVWVTSSVGLPDMEIPVGPVVEMANDDDGYYVQVFRSRSELDEFVSRLLAAANAAWPNEDA